MAIAPTFCEKANNSVLFQDFCGHDVWLSNNSKYSVSSLFWDDVQNKRGINYLFLMHLSVSTSNAHYFHCFDDTSIWYICPPDLGEDRKQSQNVIVPSSRLMINSVFVNVVFVWIHKTSALETGRNLNSLTYSWNFKEHGLQFFDQHQRLWSSKSHH
jgi:hypothetical protein